MKKTCIIFLLLLSAQAFSEEQKVKWLPYKGTALENVIDSVSVKEGIPIIVDPSLKFYENMHGLNDKNIGLNELLAILHLSDFTIQKVGSVYKIIKMNAMKQEAIPVIEPRFDLKIVDEMIVTTVVPLRKLKARSTVVVLRPHVPRWGAISPIEDTNSIIITDRYANIKKLLFMINSQEQRGA